jgi:hypothetical protein
LSIVALHYPRFSKQILKEHSRIDNFNAKKLWVTKSNDVGQKHIEVWYTSFLGNFKNTIQVLSNSSKGISIGVSRKYALLCKKGLILSAKKGENTK